MEESFGKACGNMFTWFDMAGVLPFYLSLVLTEQASLGYVSSLKMFRLLKTVRHAPGTIVLVTSLRKASSALTVPCCFCLVIMMLFASLLQGVEFLDATTTTWATFGRNSTAYDEGRRP